MSDRPLRIGLVSTRLSGTDGVSLESAKWSDVLTEMGHTCFYFAGECDRPAERSRVVPEAHFEHPEVERISADLFDDFQRAADTSEAVRELEVHLKRELRQFLEEFEIDLLLIENALAIPMNVPLGLALTALVAETSIPTIAHHHDFAWERGRFSVSAAEDYLQAAFPPAMPSIHHVVINSHGARQLALRTGMRSTLVPNVMDYDHPPPEPGAYADTLREAIGLREGEVFFLQPTRVVPRKRIERAIELVRRLDRDAVLLISHSAGDEGDEYLDYLREYAEVMGVRAVFGSKRFAHGRGETPDGEKVYSLADAYQKADMVTYPSLIEGFGNAFLEAIYYRRPLLMSAYEIFKCDIRPKGFEVIGFGEFISRETIRRASHVLSHPEEARRMTDHNYELAKRHYSFTVLRKRLRALVEQSMERAF